MRPVLHTVLLDVAPPLVAYYGLRAAIRLVVIAHLSVDAANGVNSAITLSVIGLLVLATIVVGRRSSAPAVGAA